MKASGTLKVQGHEDFEANTEYTVRLDFPSTPLTLSDIHSIEFDVSTSTNFTWNVEALQVYSIDNDHPWEYQCLFLGTETSGGGPEFAVNTSNSTAFTIGQGGCP